MTRHSSSPFKADLVFDIGQNTGQDTANYLHMGYRVVAVEANPQLVEHCEKRFKPEIDDGRLTILSGAIVSRVVRGGFVDFYPNDNNAWGTAATADGSEYSSRISDRQKPVRVPVIDLGDVLRKYGVPYYMKIDIEGSDSACLEALSGFGSVPPPYLSMESNTDSFKNTGQELAMLSSLGYAAFQIINQKDVAQNAAPTSHFEYGGSGDFGEWLPKDDWMSREATDKKYQELFVWYELFSRRGVLRNMPLRVPLTDALSSLMGYSIPSWHDTHAQHGDIA